MNLENGFRTIMIKVLMIVGMNMNKGKILEWLGYGALIAFAIWFVTGLVLDYFSHIGVNIPLSP
jgi:hypothetical protein